MENRATLNCRVKADLWWKGKHDIARSDPGTVCPLYSKHKVTCRYNKDSATDGDLAP
jgi:hypothetical protein